ncbi:MAG: hypothetical protein HYW78_04485 [Parcubacteria group bacterium]|nr:hypothetical protein [Parcubacteria group bacterium]
MVDLKNIKPQNLWYVIGYIATDGHLNKDGRHINITSKDRGHLVKIKKALSLKVKVGRKCRGDSHDKIYSQIQFGDVLFYRYLLHIGFIQRKSLNLGPIKIDRKYFIDFLRGVIDGDGSISTWIHKTNLHRQWSLRITSAAPLFIKWLKKEIESYFDVNGKLYGYKYSYKKNPIYILKFGKLATKIILYQTYHNNSLSLSRKNKKCVKCLRDENKMVGYGNVIGPGAGTGRQYGLKIR